MRLSSLLLLSLLPLSVARALPPTDTSNDDSGIADQTTLFFGKDDRTAVTNSSQWPWQAIGQVETASANLCTATLISPRLALTAGHCVLAPPGKIDRAVALRLFRTTVIGSIKLRVWKHWLMPSWVRSSNLMATAG